MRSTIASKATIAAAPVAAAAALMLGWGKWDWLALLGVSLMSIPLALMIAND